MTLRSSVLAFFFLLAMGYIAVENTTRIIEKDLKEQLQYSWQESLFIEETLASHFDLELSSQEGDQLMMPPEILADYAEGVLYKDIAYSASSGALLDVLIPWSIESGELLPVFVFIHGGTWMGGSKDSAFYSHFAREAALNRFIFVNVNYRLYPRVKFPEILLNPAEAIEWVYNHIEQYGGDREQIVVSGHSAGAHLAALLTTRSDYLSREAHQAIRKVLLFSGPYDIPAYESAEVKFKKVIEAVFLNLFGGRKMLDVNSPINGIQTDDREYLLIVGEEDEITPISQSERMHQALQEAGNDSRLAIIPDIGHGGTVFHFNRDFGPDHSLPHLISDFLLFSHDI